MGCHPRQPNFQSRLLYAKTIYGLGTNWYSHLSTTALKDKFCPYEQNRENEPFANNTSTAAFCHWKSLIFSPPQKIIFSLRRLVEWVLEPFLHKKTIYTKSLKVWSLLSPKDRENHVLWNNALKVTLFILVFPLFALGIEVLKLILCLQQFLWNHEYFVMWL